MEQRPLDLTNLVNLHDWQKIQDSFSDVLGITLRTIDKNGILISRISNPASICDKVPLETQLHKCELATMDLSVPLEIQQEVELKCPFGLKISILPVKAYRETIVAYIVLGPFILDQRKSEADYRSMAREAGLSEDELLDEVARIGVFPYERIFSIIKLLKDTFSYITQSAYHKKRLGEIAPEVVEIDPLFSRYYEEKVFNAFLKTCMIALDADSGSVMTVDKGSQTLRIKVASKIDREIIDHTHIKIGEGIAGVAAQTAQPIILPKDERKNGFSGKMKRPYIQSAMIMPFHKANDHDVYGVINLNLIRKFREFSENDIAFVRELTNLASIALIPVK